MEKSVINKKEDGKLKIYSSVIISCAFAFLLLLDFPFVNPNFGLFQTKNW